VVKSLIFPFGIHTRVPPAFPGHNKVARRYTKPPRGSAPQIKSTYFRYHATPYECLLLPHSPTPRPPIRRIARPPTPQLSSTFDSRATHARALLSARSFDFCAIWLCISSSSSSQIRLKHASAVARPPRSYWPATRTRRRYIAARSKVPEKNTQAAPKISL
jgi:hypothetical protein